GEAELGAPHRDPGAMGVGGGRQALPLQLAEQVVGGPGADPQGLGDGAVVDRAAGRGDRGVEGGEALPAAGGEGRSPKNRHGGAGYDPPAESSSAGRSPQYRADGGFVARCGGSARRRGSRSRTGSGTPALGGGPPSPAPGAL